MNSASKRPRLASVLLLAAGLTCLPTLSARAQTATPTPTPAPASAPGRPISPTLDCQSDSSTSADFNGDQIDDVALGVPFDDLFKNQDVGSINVVYGVEDDGLDTVAPGDQLFSPASSGLPAFRWVFGPGRLFGRSMAAGDFNNDSYTDLAIGAPGAPVDDIAGTGAVIVLYGSSSGLSTRFSQVLDQDRGGMPEHNDPGDAFGWTLAAGDFDGNGVDDLATAGPGEDFGKIKDGGAVWVVYGKSGARSAGGGLTTTSGRLPQLLVQGARGLLDTFDPGDMFGLALAAGNFDGDSEAGNPVDDLAIGAPQEDIGIRADTGAVQVVYSSTSGLTGDDQFWHQASPDVEGANETGDLYGCALAAGNFTGARFGSAPSLIDVDGMAIGVPGEDLAKANQGGVNVIYAESDGSGLSAVAGNDGDQFFVEHPGLAGLEEQPEAGARFGQALNAQNINPVSGSGSTVTMDPTWELVIGVPGADSGAGQVYVIGGVRGDGLRDLASSSYEIDQDSFGVVRASEPGDELGRTIAFGDYDKDGDVDIVIGAPGDSTCGFIAETSEFISIGPGIPVGADGVPHAGAALSLYSDGSEEGAFNGPFLHTTPPGIGNWSLSRCDYASDQTAIYGLSGDPQKDALFGYSVAGL